MQPAQSAAVTAIPGIVFSGGIDGYLRAYSANDGRIVWDVDTKTEYRTVNGVGTHDGSIDGPAQWSLVWTDDLTRRQTPQN